MPKPEIVRRNRLTKKQKGQLVKRFKQGFKVNETLELVKKDFPWIRRPVIAYHYNIWLDAKENKTKTGISIDDFNLPDWTPGQPERVENDEGLSLAEELSANQQTMKLVERHSNRISELKADYHALAEMYAELSAVFYKAGESLAIVERIENWTASNPISGDVVKQLGDYLEFITTNSIGITKVS
tara:strand:+ start:765 stop:1319 length:555 start_codon:yes stop_codon:yes gene_type:complete